MTTCVKWMLGVALLAASALAAAGPRIQHWTTDNGARVYFVESHELPMVQLRMVFDAGSARDTPARAGLAALTSRMLDEGAGALDADQIAARFDNLGAVFSAASARDTVTVSLRSLVEPELLDPALDLFADVIAVPTFPEDNLERERRRLLVGLQQERQSPGEIAEKAFYTGVYGAHPYASHPSGNERSLEAIARRDIADFHRRYYVAANAIVAIVGDLSRARAEALAARVTAKLARGAAAPAVAPVADLVQAQVSRVAFASTQSHLLIGAPGLARNDPDYFPLLVGNYILGGGGLVSRLSDEVREKQGLAYSVYSYFLPMRERGPFMIGLQTKNAQLAQALQLVRKVVADFIAAGPTPKELDAAKRHLSGGFPLRIDSNQKIAEHLAMIGFYGLPLNYLDEFIARVDAVTIEQVREAYRRRVQPERMLTVIVGGAGG